MRLGKFFTRMLLIDKLNNFKWNLVNIYGAAHERDKANFLIELGQVLGSNNHCSHPFWAHVDQDPDLLRPNGRVLF